MKFRKYFQIRETIGKSTHFVLNKSVNNLGCTKVVILAKWDISGLNDAGMCQLKIATKLATEGEIWVFGFFTSEVSVVIKTDQLRFDQT